MPGHTALTLMMYCPQSMASALVRPTIACFEATYGAAFGIPTRRASEATLTMAPARRGIIERLATAVDQ